MALTVAYLKGNYSIHSQQNISQYIYMYVCMCTTVPLSHHRSKGKAIVYIAYYGMLMRYMHTFTVKIYTGTYTPQLLQGNA